LLVFASVLLLTALSLCVVGLLRLRMVHASPYTNISVATAYNMITSGLYPDLVVLDVRWQYEYDGGHIYGAVWIPVSELDARIGELAGHENHEVIVYCKSGGRSVTASGILDSHNFTKVYNMLGGILAWQSAGYPVWIATVHNVNTTFNYDTIQAALDAPQTLDGHTILVDAGTYREHVVVNKNVSLIGENKSNIIIDGSGTGTVIRVDDPSYINIANFTVQNGEYGIFLNTSFPNTLRNNTINNNTYNFGVRTESIYDMRYHHDVDTSNTVDGKPVYWWVDQQNRQIPPDAGYVAVVDSKNITVRDLNLTKNVQGVLFSNTTDSMIRNVTVSNNEYGIVLHNSHNNAIFHNNLVNNTNQVALYESSSNTWDGGYPSGGNYWSGYTDVDLFCGPYQNITRSDGIGDTSYVIDANNTDNYPLMKPYGGPHDLGIVNVTTSETLVVQGQNLSINAKIVNYGANSEVFNVTAYANTTIIQTRTITLTNRNSTTVTLTGNTTGLAKGNYNISAEVGPVPSEIDTTDNTRTDGLVKLILQEHDIAITNVMPYKTVVGRGCNVPISVTAENWGNYTETFNATAYYNPENASGIPIETQTGSLTIGGSTTVTLTWNTTGVPYGNYAITAKATPLPNETDTSDNTLTEGWILVTVVGDVNGDARVSVADMVQVDIALGTRPGDPNHNPNADVNDDGRISIADMVQIDIHLGEKW